MAERIELHVDSGQRISCFRARPSKERKGGIVVLHAVFGLTPHLANVCDRFAEEGYEAIAPGLFDRVAPDSVYSYTRAGVDAGSASYGMLTETEIFSDVTACAEVLRASGKVAIAGFCTGGTWAWRAAGSLAFDAHVNFYGSHVPVFIELPMRCPTIMHYGDCDTIVPIAEVNRIARQHPEIRFEIYAGSGHAFFNPDQTTHEPKAAALAWARSLTFLETYLAGARR